MTPADAGMAAARQQQREIDRFGYYALTVTYRAVKAGWICRVEVEDEEGNRAHGINICAYRADAYEQAMICAGERLGTHS